MKKAGEILESLKQFEGVDEGTQMFWRAQDIALEGCKTIADKLQEYIKDGYVEEFYNLLYRIVALIEHEKGLDPRKLINDIQDDALSLDQEEHELDDANWLKSGMDDKTRSLGIFNNLIQEKL